MIIKVKTPNKCQGSDHRHLSRRDFIARGMLTGAMTVALPKILLGGLIKDAVAGPACPTPQRDPGGISHLYCDGGMTVGAYILTDIPAQIAAASTSAASRYGIDGSKMLNLGPTGASRGFNINEASIFGAALLQAGLDLGYTRAQWRVVLSRISAGAHYGCNTQDDGGADNTGLIGGVGPLKNSALSRDLRLGVRHKLVPFANGMRASKTGGNPSVSTLTNVFSMTPAASGRTNEQTITNSANAAASLASLFAGMLGMSGRTGAEAATTNTTCGFLGDIPLADPSYGPRLFDAAQVPALQGLVSAAGGKLSNGERAYLASYYNAAIGVVSGLAVQENGFDYHGQSATNIGNAAYRAARHVALWAAASDKAGVKTSFVMNTNGQARAVGFTNASINGTGGSNVTANVQNADGDAGGNLSASTLLCHAPAGQTPPRLKNTGAFDTNNGDVRGSLGSELALQGIYASAIEWISGSLTNSQITRLGLMGVNLTPVKLI
jgi:hypothetical protein